MKLAHQVYEVLDAAAEPVELPAFGAISIILLELQRCRPNLRNRRKWENRHCLVRRPILLAVGITHKFSWGDHRVRVSSTIASILLYVLQQQSFRL